MFGRLFLGLGFWQCRLGFFLPFLIPFLIPSLSLSSSVGSSPSSSSLFPLTNDHLHFSSQNLQMGMMDVTQKVGFTPLHTNLIPSSLFSPTDGGIITLIPLLFFRGCCRGPNSRTRPTNAVLIATLPRLLCGVEALLVLRFLSSHFSSFSLCFHLLFHLQLLLSMSDSWFLSDYSFLLGFFRIQYRFSFLFCFWLCSS